MNLVEFAKRELKIAGYNVEKKQPSVIDTEEDYVNACAKSALDMIKVFSKAGHSGMSAEITLMLFEKLVRQRNLTPLDNNPKDWEKTIDGNLLQSKRNTACFSDDNLVTYFNVEEDVQEQKAKENSEGYKDWKCIEQIGRKYHKLKAYK